MRGNNTFKILLILCALLVLPSPSIAQNGVHLKGKIAEFYFEHDALITDTHYKRFDKLVASLEKKRDRQSDDKRFLRTLFHKTHNKLLTRYNSLASMDETIKDGTYGCLTGTIIYALLLDHFGFDFDIIELPNHVFIKVNTNESEVYFESTMPTEGFITDPRKVRLAEASYRNIRNSSLQIVSQEGSNLTNIEDYKIIGLKELNALQHFNESVKLFKLANYEESITHAVKAFEFYPTDKNKMLMKLVINKIMNNQEIEADERERLIHVYRSHHKKDSRDRLISIQASKL